MPKILINDEVLNSDNQNMSINDLMGRVLNDHLSENEVITNVYTNGEELPLEEGALNQNIANFESINFKVQSSIELTFDAINSCSSYIDVTVEKILELCAAYKRNEMDKANALFGEVIEIVDLYVQLISGIQTSLSTHLPEKFEKTEVIKKLELHLLSIIKGLVPAREKGDFAMLCDLLEYELIDNLKQWKVMIIPEFKKIRPMA